MYAAVAASSTLPAIPPAAASTISQPAALRLPAVKFDGSRTTLRDDRAAKPLGLNRDAYLH